MDLFEEVCHRVGIGGLKRHMLSPVWSLPLLLNCAVSAQLFLLSHASALPAWTRTPGNIRPIRCFSLEVASAMVFYTAIEKELMH